MSKIKTCIVCGKKYEYCGHCDKSGQENRWKTNYCSENCRDIFNIVSKYVNKHISVDDAKKGLVELDLGVITKDNILKYCNEIISYTEPKDKDELPKSVEESKDEVSDDVINDTSVEDNQEVTSSTETAPKSKRRRRYVSKSEK